jgi:hypothetical protein
MFEEAAERREVQLRARMTDLEERLEAALEILALLRPATAMLNERGVDEFGRRAIYLLVDEMTSRVDEGVPASYIEFEERISTLIPDVRGDRRFFELLIGSLKLEYPGSRRLFEHLASAMALLRA